MNIYSNQDRWTFHKSMFTLISPDARMFFGSTETSIYQLVTMVTSKHSQARIIL